MQSKLVCTVLAMALCVSVQAVNYPNQPLVSGFGVQHNLMFVMDDTGSMLWETFFDSTDGLPGFDEPSGSFVDNAGNLYSKSNGIYYGHLFSQKTVSYYLRVPPLSPYAFMRSNQWNPAYYDPNITYEPWPSYAGITWPDANPTQAWHNPARSQSGDLKLNLTVDQSGKFDIKPNLLCDEQGTLCGDHDEREFNYYPATYYKPNTTDSYEYRVSSPGGSTAYVDPATEGIVVDIDSPVTPGFTQVDSSLASDGAYYHYADSQPNYFSAPPVDTTLTLRFTTAAAKVRIFIRRQFPTQNDDSLWVSLENHDPNTIEFPPLTTSEQAQGGHHWQSITGATEQHWHAWRHGHDRAPNTLGDVWVWEEWGVATLDGSNHYALHLKARDNGVSVDQVLIATDLNYRPDQLAQRPILTNSLLANEVRRCDSGYTPVHYHEYRANPSAFSSTGAVDAIAPDGSCLTRVEIKNTGTDFDHGNGLVRTYAQEMQNFATWYVYHRNRSLVMRHALGSAMQGVTHLFAGMNWFNRSNTIAMHDLNDSTAQNAFLNQHYSATFGGGTPLRSALSRSGSQLTRTTDPIITSYCQLNYGLVFTDGYNNQPVLSSLSVGNADGDKGAPYADDQSDTLADIAMHYYTTDLAAGLGLTAQDVRLPSECPATGGAPLDKPWLDCNDRPHLKTYGISFGLPGLLFNQPISLQDNRAPAGRNYINGRDVYDYAPTWPGNMNEWDKRQIDDLYHATVNGRGQMFIATRPSELASQFSQALQAITSDIRSGSGISVNTITLDQDAFIFNANFDPGRWSGQFIANQIRYDENNRLQQRESWQANTELFNDFATAFTPADSIDLNSVNSNRRVVVTYSDVNEDGRFHGVPFRWNADLDPSQRADLNLSTQTAAADGNGEARLNYLRGVLYETRYPGDYRDRFDNILGTIVNSDPVFIGQTRTGRRWPDQDPFGSSSNRYQQHFIINELLAGNGRTPMVYVGANDGMLHGFEADSGAEKLAYVPRTLFSSEPTQGLHYLSSPLYSHRFMVDGPLSAEDVYISDDGSSADWMTVLVGSFRSGGRGIFALNVTDPNVLESNADRIALWEFSPTTLPGLEIGYQINPARIGMMADHSWSVIIGSGTDLPTSTAHGGVYILDIQGGSDGRWDRADYRFLSVDTPADIVSVAAVDADNDYIIERLYAADLQGRVWVFDVSDSDPNNWGSAYSLAGNAQPLFSTGGQPISAPLLITRQASSGQQNAPPNLLVVFGTGQYLETADDTNTNVQSFYTIWDHGTGGLSRADLTVRALTSTVENGFTARHTTGRDWYHFDPGSNGFYFDFNDPQYPGERVLNRPFVRLDDNGHQTVIFPTITPVVNPQACVKEYVSWLMFINLDTGHDSDSAFNPNDPTQPYNGQVSGFLIDGSNGLNGITGLFNNQGGEQIIGANTDGSINQLGELADPFTRRNKAWRELYR